MQSLIEIDSYFHDVIYFLASVLFALAEWANVM